MKIPCYGAQHTKTTARDHGLNRDGDAIVIRLPGAILTSPGSILRMNVEFAVHAGRQLSDIRQKCPIALPAIQWVALGQADQARPATMSGGTTMTTQPTPKGAWKITFLLFLFMLVNFADKIVVGLAGVPIMTE